MSGMAVQKMADRVAELMEQRLRVRGVDLAAKLRRGARLLPRKVRRNAAYLAQASSTAQVPAMQARLDHQRITDAYDVCIRYLKPLGASARRRALLLDMLRGIWASALVTLTLVLVVLVWRGFV
ncbi:MAG: hypothetical protein KDE11_07010 [Rhodobacteraceae bacterium]|nr:hypothetical protein [Paracoccaceae bacterium]